MQTIEAQNDEELEMVRQIIERAHEWALEHFNAAGAETATLLTPLAYFVEFPALDRMIVSPAMYGKMKMSFEYQLVLSHRGAYWLGKHPIYNIYLPKLWITPKVTP